MKKFLIGLIACMFIASSLPGIIGEQDADEYTFKERRVIDHREIKAVYTEHGLEKVPGARGKPGVTVDITNPENGDTVSGTVTITVDATYTPTISIDGTAVITDTTYTWYTNQYADGTHTIRATTRGVTDTITVTVNNGGGGNTPPVVSITNPSNGATVSGSVSITVDANDVEDGELTADIFIDDAHITTANSYSWDTTIYSDGGHTIRADVEDTGGLTDSHSITVTVNNGGGEGNRYALVIGISDYEGTSSDLQYCDDDAQDWKNFLQGEGYTVTMLTDHQATADNIIAAIDNLLADEYADDYVVLAYSGHGTEISGYGSCIVTHDLYGIDHGYFESRFSTADSQHIFFSFDACVIGDFQGLVTNNRVGAFASNNRYSYDGDASMQNGVFTYYQMDGWDNQNFDNFEDDAAYAVQEMKDWPPSPRIKVDPFYVDQFAGTMYP